MKTVLPKHSFPGTARVCVLALSLGLLLGGCSQPGSGTPPLGEDQAAVDAFNNDETVQEALNIEAGEIDLDLSAGELAAIAGTIEAAFAAYGELPQGAKTALSQEKASWTL